MEKLSILILRREMGFPGIKLWGVIFPSTLLHMIMRKSSENNNDSHAIKITQYYKSLLEICFDVEDKIKGFGLID